MLSNAPVDISFEELLWVSQMRWTIAQLFQEGKDFLGLDEYEMHSYPGWHRHMALVNVTMHFLLTIRLEFGKKNYINLPIAQKLVDAAMTGDPFKISQAIKTVSYQFRRAEVARVSHRKRRLLEYQALLF